MLAQIIVGSLIWLLIGTLVMLGLNSTLMVPPQQIFIATEMNLFGKISWYAFDVLVVLFWPAFGVVFIMIGCLMALQMKFFPKAYAKSVPLGSSK